MKWWSSEEIIIWYKSPIDNKPHRYFPDFFICLMDKNGNEKIKVIELKPQSQVREPKRPQRITEDYIKKVQEFGRNQAKWESAKTYCLIRGYEFKILTEIELGIKC